MNVRNISQDKLIDTYNEALESIQNTIREGSYQGAVDPATLNYFLSPYKLDDWSEDKTIEKNILYVRIQDNALEYTVLIPKGKIVNGVTQTEDTIVKGTIEKDVLEKKILNPEKIDILQPFNIEKLNPFLPHLLKVTGRNGHTFQILKPLNKGGTCNGEVRDWFKNLKDGKSSKTFSKTIEKSIRELEEIIVHCKNKTLDLTDAAVRNIFSEIAYIESLQAIQYRTVSIGRKATIKLSPDNFKYDIDLQILNRYEHTESRESLASLLKDRLLPGRCYKFAARGHAIGCYVNPENNIIEIFDPNDEDEPINFDNDHQGHKKTADHLFKCFDFGEPTQELDLEIAEYTFQKKDLEIITDLEKELKQFENYLEADKKIPKDIKERLFISMNYYYFGELSVDLLLLRIKSFQILHPCQLTINCDDYLDRLHVNLTKIYESYKIKADENILFYGIETLNDSIFRTFVTNKQLLNQQNNDLNTPLHIAIANKEENMAKICLQHGAEQKQNKDGNTPLHLAVQNNCSLDIISALISALSDLATINQKNIKGYTALHEAIQNKSLDVIRTLIDAGASVDIADFKEAIENKNINLIYMLLPGVSLQQLNFFDIEFIVESFTNDPDAKQNLDIRKNQKPMINLLKYMVEQYRYEIEMGVEPKVKNKSIDSAIQYLSKICQLDVNDKDSYQHLANLCQEYSSAERTNLLAQAKLENLINALLIQVREFDHSDKINFNAFFKASMIPAECKVIRELVDRLSKAANTNGQNLYKESRAILQMQSNIKSPETKKIIEDYLNDELLNDLSKYAELRR